MAVLKAQIRSGVYHDSIVLMQLQRVLRELPGILDAGVVMGTVANKAILARTDLLATEAEAAEPDDLVIVVSARDNEAALDALAQVDGLLCRHREVVEQEYVPRSLDTAFQMVPDAQWVLVSVPGRYAADVTRDALRLGRSVFLFSDNVSSEDEVSLKLAARENGLLVMGPDCGSAIINGVGLGFANHVRRGPIGVVAASGTGLQVIACRAHQLGSGISHALGTGGRDLLEAVGAVTAQQALDLLRRDPETQVIVLVSKPPSPAVADRLLELAREVGKPVVVDFIGYGGSPRGTGDLHQVATLDGAAHLAVQLASESAARHDEPDVAPGRFSPGQRFLRGLYTGGTLAHEALLILQDYLPAVYSNVPLESAHNRLQNALVSQENTIVDLGDDEFTVGRLHPMMDNDLRIRRLEQEAADPAVAVILLDVVLGYGAHPNPAGDLARAIATAREAARTAGRHLEVVAVLVGTDDDPQGFVEQVTQLQGAGARVETSHGRAVRYVGRLARSLAQVASQQQESVMPPVDLAILRRPLAAVNVGLEVFAQSLKAQDASVIHVDWRPPAGGNEQLMAILRRTKQAASQAQHPPHEETR